MTVFLAKVNHGTISFNSDYNRERFKDWLAKNEGRRLKITTDDSITGELRRFFEGAIVPYFFYQSGVAFKSKEEAREALKLEFNHEYFRGVDGRTKMSARSTADLNKKEFLAFLEKIENYFLENGFLYPDSEDFKDWDKHAHAPDEIYPPLKRLMNLHYEKVTYV